jgi:tetratricopeptide (TPR) repeat protein
VRKVNAFSTRFGVSARPSRAGSSPSSASSFLISSCIVLFYLSAAAAQSPDALYADRANLASARQAAAAWTSQLAANPASFEAAWKLARADYWLGGHAPEAERRQFLEQGIAAGRSAIALDARRPEGHFWVAANMGALAESFGVRAGLKYRTPIREELETVLRLDPAFQGGSADRALGRWYFKVPRLFGGDHKLAEQHLRASMTYQPASTASHFFLAELLLDEGRKPEARAELQQVLDAPLDPDWTPEDQEFKAKARVLIASHG